MPNPRLVLCDTDALIQLLLTYNFNQKLLPLRHLRDDYGIQPTIVEEVETELMWTRRYGQRFVPVVKKALTNGTIKVLDEATFSSHVPTHLAKTVYASYQALGLEHGKFSDRGEAYTLAAGVTLGQPAASNDASAIAALEANGFALPSPVLRFFDFLALCHQTGALSEAECDAIRQELRRIGEHVPFAFKNASFGSGLSNFCPRILDDNLPPIGAPAGAGPPHRLQIKISKRS